MVPMASCRRSSSGSSVNRDDCHVNDVVPHPTDGDDTGIAEVSGIEERIPENVIATSVNGTGYSIGLYLGGVLRDLDVLTEYFIRYEDSYSVAGLHEFAKSRKLSPMMLWKGFSLLVEYEMPATLEMFELWSSYSASYLGEAEGEQYISGELGCPVASASERDKLTVFTPKWKRK